MKTNKVMFWVCVSVITAAAVAIAAEETTQTTTNQQQTVRAAQRQQRPMPGRTTAATDPNTANAATRDMFREALTRRMESSRAEVAKLQAILKIAEEEKATKTAEALKTLIAEKEKEAKDQVEQAERRRQEMQQRVQQRANQTGAVTTGTPADADQVRPEDAESTPRQGRGGLGGRGQQRQQTN